MISYRADRGVTEVVDLVGPKVQRSIDQPVPGAVYTSGDLIDQLRQAIGELGDDEGEDAADGGKPTDQNQPHRPAARGAV